LYLLHVSQSLSICYQTQPGKPPALNVQRLMNGLMPQLLCCMHQTISPTRQPILQHTVYIITVITT
jgi:hypothetical protein